MFYSFIEFKKLGVEFGCVEKSKSSCFRKIHFKKSILIFKRENFKF